MLRDRRLRDTGRPHVHGRWFGAGLAAAIPSSLAACGGSAGLTSLAEAGKIAHGVSVPVASGGTALVGSAIFCVGGDQPAEVTAVGWEHSEDVLLVDYAVVTQRVGDVRLGTGDGPIGPEIRGDQSRQIHGRCDVFDEEGNFAPGVGEDTDVSYLVVELLLGEAHDVGVVSGLRVDSDQGRAVDPIEVTLCDAEAVPECPPGDG